MKYSVRHSAPKESGWLLIKADTPADAAQEFHFRNPTGVYLPDEENGSPSAKGTWYSVVEVDTGKETEKFVSRIFVSGIGRKGGVRPAYWATNILDVAARLKMDVDYLTNNWEGERDEWEKL